MPRVPYSWSVGGPLHADRHPSGTGPPEAAAGAVPEPRTLRTRLEALWHAVVGATGLVVGLLPHVLHHVGLLAGTALVAGSGGTALFGALGFAASIPMLVRLYRRFGSWVAPVLGLLVFTAMFSLSAFVIGPAISGSGDSGPGGGGNPGPEPTVNQEPTVNHTEHTGH